jgi:hypothetical protein
MFTYKGKDKTENTALWKYIVEIQDKAKQTKRQKHR